jgi:hypothetical protein
MIAERRDSMLAADRTCVTNEDCVTVSVDLSCARACSVDSVSAGAAAKLESDIAGLEAEYCQSSWECSVPDASCPRPQTRPVCVYGTCSQEDPAHSGCDDACGCAARVSAQSTGVWQNECGGFDLWPILGTACGSCTDPTTAIVVGNRGSKRFTGDATLSFESIGGLADPPRPDPVVVTLDLGPGEVSPAIHVPSRGAGGLAVRVSAVGDCSTANDASAYADFPPIDACN